MDALNKRFDLTFSTIGYSFINLIYKIRKVWAHTIYSRQYKIMFSFSCKFPILYVGQGWCSMFSYEFYIGRPATILDSIVWTYVNP